MSQEKVGAIGLGLLGSVLVERLLQSGRRVAVHNRTRDKAAPLIAKGAVWSDNPLAECDIVVICLYTTDIVEETIDRLGELRPGTILIDTTTGDPRQTTLLGQKLEQHGVAYLESPIAASSDQTLRGEAVAIVAGPLEAFERAREVITAIAPRSVHVGPWGNAAKMKLVNNLILGLTRLALAEGLAFARAVGLPVGDALECLKQGNAYSVVMDVKGRKMVEEDFSTQAKLSQHLKDVRIILNEASRLGIDLPMSELHRSLLERVEAAGYGELDNCAILKAYDRGPAGTSFLRNK